MLNLARPSGRAGEETVDSAGPPERPGLCPGVTLMGRLSDSAFTDPQWLIERDGHFIQVAELVYVIAQFADGQRTLGQIAEAVTEATEWHVTPQQVGAIISAKLIPLRLIPPGGVTDPSALPTKPPTSSLMLRGRRKVLGSSVIEPVTGLLQVLFVPALAIPIMTLAVIAHAWLYFGHGIAAALRDIAYTPGALLAALVLLLAAGAAHEFGHASALRYGGGHARSIGVGIYLVFPVYYTDTTDSYRLGRWARVRTDVGGFYFHLIAALAIIGFYLLTGQEWLLVAVLLINLDIARQLVPFIRFDGYWALCDLLGIPDLLSHMRSQAKRALGRWLWRRPSVGGGPELLPWARRVFTAYALVTVPILSVLLVILVLRAPLVFAALWSALVVAQDMLGRAWSQHQSATVVGASLHLALLVIQAAGVAYMLVTLGTRMARRIWRWSRGSGRRRIGAAVVSALAIGLLAIQWSSAFAATTGAKLTGLQGYPVTQRAHVQEPVSYAQSPPVGGNHSPIWQNCGFYRTPIANEHAVHSLEHGAVWITYRPDLAPGEIAALRVLAVRQSYVLVSPYPSLRTPVVATAWGLQLDLRSAADPQLDQFVRLFRLSKLAPERGGQCTGGIGTPER